MTIQKATGIILRVRPYSDTTLIVHWLTPDLGRLATIAKGARRPKSPFRGQLDLFYSAEFSFARSARSDLHTLREVKTFETHSRLRTDFAYVAQASYAAALIEQATEPEAPLPILHQHFTQFLAVLPERPAQAQSIFALEMKVLHDLGLAPNLADNALTPGSRQILAKLTELDWPALSCVHLSAAQLSEIRDYLHHFLGYHLGKVPQSRAVAGGWLITNRTPQIGLGGGRGGGGG